MKLWLGWRCERSPFDRRLWVKSVAFYNRRPSLDFRYAPLATKLARRCNISRRAKWQSLLSKLIASPGVHRVGLLFSTPSSLPISPATTLEDEQIPALRTEAQ
jgi:hypothetical protein